MYNHKRRFPCGVCGEDVLCDRENGKLRCACGVAPLVIKTEDFNAFFVEIKGYTLYPKVEGYTN